MTSPAGDKHGVGDKEGLEEAEAKETVQQCESILQSDVRDGYDGHIEVGSEVKDEADGETCNDEATAGGLNALGATHVECPVDEVVVDNDAKLVTTPAYMLAQSISEANASITKMVKTVLAMK